VFPGKTTKPYSAKPYKQLQKTQIKTGQGCFNRLTSVTDWNGFLGSERKGVYWWAYQLPRIIALLQGVSGGNLDAFLKFMSKAQ
jgi:hypothetical protein